MKAKQLEIISATLAIVLIALFVGVMISFNVYAESKPQPTPESPDFFVAESQSASSASSTSVSGDSLSSANVSGDTNIDMGSSVSISLPDIAYDHLGGGIACNKTTFGVTAYGQDSQDFGGALTVLFATGGQDCKANGKLQSAKMRWEAIDRAVERMEACSSSHHRRTIHDNADADLIAFRSFCKGVETHKKVLIAPENERVSNHRK